MCKCVGRLYREAIVGVAIVAADRDANLDALHCIALHCIALNCTPL